MKKLFSITFVLMLVISLTACGNSAKNSSGQSVPSSSKKISREIGEEKLMEISEKLMDGEITPEEAKKMQKEITNKMESQGDFLKRINNNISNFNGMPSWATSLNINEPKGLTLIPTESNIIKAKGLYPDSFTTVYEGDKETLMSESKRISKELNLKIDFEAPDTFMASGNVDKYTVVITVTNNGKGLQMNYSASDMSEQ